MAPRAKNGQIKSPARRSRDNQRSTQRRRYVGGRRDPIRALSTIWSAFVASVTASGNAVPVFGGTVTVLSRLSAVPSGLYTNTGAAPNFFVHILSWLYAQAKASKAGAFFVAPLKTLLDNPAKTWGLCLLLAASYITRTRQQHGVALFTAILVLLMPPQNEWVYVAIAVSIYVYHLDLWWVYRIGVIAALIWCAVAWGGSVTTTKFGSAQVDRNLPKGLFSVD